MKNALLMMITASLLLAACGALPASARAGCPITPVDDPDTRLLGPEDGLRAFVVNDGVWDMLPVYEDGSLGQKIMWKYPGYDWQAEPVPEFLLVAEEVGGEGYFEVDQATNAYHEEDLFGSAILTGVEFPHAGCWQLTGHYRDSQLTFVVWVGGQGN